MHIIKEYNIITHILLNVCTYFLHYIQLFFLLLFSIIYGDPFFTRHGRALFSGVFADDMCSARVKKTAIGARASCDRPLSRVYAYIIVFRAVDPTDCTISICLVTKTECSFIFLYFN